MKVEKIVGKVVTMHGMTGTFIGETDMSEDLLYKLLKIEMTLC